MGGLKTFEIVAIERLREEQSVVLRIRRTNPGSKSKQNLVKLYFVYFIVWKLMTVNYYHSTMNILQYVF